jgi:hypothetical protein
MATIAEQLAERRAIRAAKAARFNEQLASARASVAARRLAADQRAEIERQDRENGTRRPTRTAVIVTAGSSTGPLGAQLQYRQRQEITQADLDVAISVVANHRLNSAFTSPELLNRSYAIINAARTQVPVVNVGGVVGGRQGGGRLSVGLSADFTAIQRGSPAGAQFGGFSRITKIGPSESKPSPLGGCSDLPASQQQKPGASGTAGGTMLDG